MRSDKNVTRKRFLDDIPLVSDEAGRCKHAYGHKPPGLCRGLFKKSAKV